MNLYTNSFMHKEFYLRFIPKLLVLFIFLLSHIHSSAQNDETGEKPKKNWPAVINKITDLGLPSDMVYRIRRMNKAQMDTLHGEDYHENIVEGEGDNKTEYVLKVMLRFVDGKIIGFVKKEPMMQSNQGTYLSQIDIPLQWCGTDSLKQEHCVQSEEEMFKLDSGVVIAPRDWHQRLDAIEISSDVVSNNIDMLKLLESKSGRKKLQSNKSVTALKKILPQLAGDDSVHVANQLTLMIKEEQEAKRRKLGGDFVPDSTIEVITAGLSGPDSIAAIKKYIATRKAEKALKGDKKYQKGVLALDSTTIASVTKGLSGADSINALKSYLEPKIVKAPKKKKGEEMLDSTTIASITKGLSGSDSVDAIRSYIMSQNVGKANKKVNYNGNVNLDSTTIASVTKGLTGQDSIVALRNYVNAERDNRKHKKRVKEVANLSTPSLNPTSTDSSTVQNPVAAVVVPPPSKPVKIDKKKKKSDELDDSTITTITKGLTGSDSVNAIREYKMEASRFKNDHKRKKINKTEQVIPADTPTVPPPVPTQSTPIATVNNNQDSVSKSFVTPPAAKDTVAATPPPVPEPVVPQRVRVAPIIKDTTANQSVVLTTPKDTTATPPAATPVAAPSIPQPAPAIKDTTTATPPAAVPVPTPAPQAAPAVVNTPKDTTTATPPAAVPVPTPAPQAAPAVVNTPKDTTTATPPAAVPVPTSPAPQAAPAVVSTQKDTTTQSSLPNVVKDSTDVAPPVVPVQNSGRQRVREIAPVPTTDSTTNKATLPSVTDTTGNANKPSLPVVDSSANGNKIPVAADSTKPK